MRQLPLVPQLVNRSVPKVHTNRENVTMEEVGLSCNADPVISVPACVS